MAGDEPDFFPNPAFLSTALLNGTIENRRLFLDNQKPLWRLRAIGSETIFGGGQWYFTGRLNALGRIVAWLKATGDGNGLIVTGNPGSGKSALLGFLHLASEARELEEPSLKSLVASIPETSRPIAGSIAFALVLKGDDVGRCYFNAIRALRHDTRSSDGGHNRYPKTNGSSLRRS